MIPDSMIERAVRAIRGRIGDDLVDDDYCQVVAQAALEAALQDAEIVEADYDDDSPFDIAFTGEWSPGRYLVVPLGGFE